MKRMRRFDEEHEQDLPSIRQLLIELLNSETLTENTRATVGRYTARRDAPHYPGDTYHAHVKDGSNEYSWRDNGSRKHQNKFGKKTPPKDAKQAAATVLGVDPTILENQATETNLRKFGEILRQVLHEKTDEMSGGGVP